MDWNKEEAIRAKDIAEKRMQSKDFEGARKIALKAQQLFPDLENISQMITVCTVHCSSATKVTGSEMDWYAILEVEQTADEASIKKQYRKLALLLHPDKNKFPGAEAAFKLIGEAQRVLSDQAKRSLYDMKRTMSVRATGTRQAPPHLNRNSNAWKQSNIQKPSNVTNSQFTGTNQQQTETMSFWTMCPFCSMKFQYYLSVMNRALRCRNCQSPFIAYDINTYGQGVPSGAPSEFGSNQSGIAQQKGFSFQNDTQVDDEAAVNSNSNLRSRGGTLQESVSSNVGGRAQSQAAEGKAKSKKTEEVHKRTQNHKRGRKIIVEDSSESGDTNSNDEEDEVTAGVDISRRHFDTTSGRYPRRSTRQKQRVIYNEDGSDDDDFVIPSRSKKSRIAGASCDANGQRKNVEESKDVYETRERANGVPISIDEAKESSEVTKNIERQQAEFGKREVSSQGEDASSKVFMMESDNKNQSNLQPFIYDEPEFYDFDKDRTESHFADKQIWAAYDPNGGMPRFYAYIRRVVPEQSKLDIYWLEPYLDFTDADEVSWVEKELPYGCGNFVCGSEDETDFSVFAYMVSCDRVKNTGIYKIYPRKGDIWAVFKDWNIKWSLDPDMHRKYKFEIVEIVSDFDEKTGVRVAHLIKIKGFVSLFHRTQNSEIDSFLIKANEMLRFSHRIPACRMTGKERENVPRGSYELDPASLPSDIEEVDLCHFTSVDGVMRDLGSMHNEANGSCFGPATEQEEAKECKVPKKKDIHKSDNTNDMNDRGDSTFGISKVYVKNDKDVKCEKGNPDGFADRKGKEASMADCQAEKHSGAERNDTTSGASSVENLDYPDPEFYSFDGNKSEDKFEPGQIWALYSDVDSLPKFYGQVRNVGSGEFEVEIQWLEAHPSMEDEIQWSDKTLPTGCGTFRLTREIDGYNTTMTFSHMIKADGLSKRKFRIIPKRGEVWALYKNFSIHWTRQDLESCEYDIVRIINSTGSGLRVKVLEKVRGYNSVFSDFGLEMEIARRDFLRFSHQIPAFQLTEEKGGKLRGCLELDPAAVPSILFCTTSD